MCGLSISLEMPLHPFLNQWDLLLGMNTILRSLIEISSISYKYWWDSNQKDSFKVRSSDPTVDFKYLTEHNLKKLLNSSNIILTASSKPVISKNGLLLLQSEEGKQWLLLPTCDPSIGCWIPSLQWKRRNGLLCWQVVESPRSSTTQNLRNINHALWNRGNTMALAMIGQKTVDITRRRVVHEGYKIKPEQVKN